MGDTGTRQLRPGAQSPAWSRSVGRCYALVVGIDDYQSLHPPLRFAVKDAEAVAARLEADFGFTVTRLLDRQATAGAILRALDGWLAGTRPDDEVVLFFAGHGTQVHEPGRPVEGFLIPSGSGADPGEWLSEADLIDRLRRIPAQRAFLVFDACYAGTAFRLRDDILPGARDDQVLKVLVAGTEDEPVLDGGAGNHSVFTRTLLDGLDGLADSGRQPDGILSAGELIVYVRSEVPWRSRLRGLEQTPVGGSVGGTRRGDDFFFRPAVPRLPATLLRNLYSNQVEDRLAAAAQLGAMRGTATAGLAAEELLHLARDERAQEGERLLSAEATLEVQTGAVRALGELGHPAGFPHLIQLVRGSGERRLRLAAAPALGRLAAAQPGLPSEPVADAIAALTDALHDHDPAVREAAVQGLGQIPPAAERLAAGLETLAPAERRRRLDALACLAMNHPDEDAAWPRLAGPAACLWRRVYLARRRLRPQWPAVLLHAIAVGGAGAVGLGLAYLSIVLAAFWPDAAVFLPAVAAVNALPGALAGIALTLGPRLSVALSRRANPRLGAPGGLLAGLVLGPAMAVPNWFLHIGCNAAGCGRAIALWWLLPGLVTGPIVGLALAGLASGPARGLRHLWRGGAAAAVTGGLALALAHIPPPMLTGRVDPPAAEVGLWGLGGALLGWALAIGWRLRPGGAREATTGKEGEPTRNAARHALSTPGRSSRRPQEET